jgi:hypothetical protein
MQTRPSLLSCIVIGVLLSANGKTPAQTLAVPSAKCGPGSSPETGIQGQVPLADRVSGRSRQGYSCNLELVSQYQGQGASWVDPAYGHCVYLAEAVLGNVSAVHRGVSVLNVSNPQFPVHSTDLTSPGMLGGPWESLKVNQKRALLAGVSAGPLSAGPGIFDVYSLGSDCALPVLQNTFLSSGLALPVTVLGHEGGWAPDGFTYWSSGIAFGALAAIDVTNPKKPAVVYSGFLGVSTQTHGFSISTDGNRMYIGTIFPAGVLILDISDIQSRQPVPQIRQIASVTWTDGFFTQHTIPITYAGHPYLIAVDEAGSGGARFIDIANETNPTVISQIKLAINMPNAAQTRANDLHGNGAFGYEAHYCSVDQAANPTALACGWFQSGVRVFDIRNPLKVKEIAYFNPPAQSPAPLVTPLPSSEHANGVFGRVPPILTELDAQNLPNLLDVAGLTGPNMTADWCSSPPEFVGNQLWVTCQDNGFLVLKFTNNAYPLQ